MPAKKVRNTVPVVLIVLAVLACVPVVGAIVATAQGIRTVVNGSGTAGFVTVTSCGTRWLVVPECRGDFAYADPEAQGSAHLTDVPLANDMRVHGIGTRVEASLNTGSNKAYATGAFPVLIAVLAILVVLFVLAATYATLSRVARRHQVVLPGPILTFVLAVGLAALLMVPFGDHSGTGTTTGPPPAVTGTP